MNMTKKDFQIGKKTKEDEIRIQSVAESFVSGMPRETTKTFRMPEDLAYSLKKHAVETRQTEKDILVNLVSSHLKNVGAI
jgi:hypothetical protein